MIFTLNKYILEMKIGEKYKKKNFICFGRLLKENFIHYSGKGAAEKSRLFSV